MPRGSDLLSTMAYTDVLYRGSIGLLKSAGRMERFEKRVRGPVNQSCHGLCIAKLEGKPYILEVSLSMGHGQA